MAVYCIQPMWVMADAWSYDPSLEIRLLTRLCQESMDSRMPQNTTSQTAGQHYRERHSSCTDFFFISAIPLPMRKRIPTSGLHHYHHSSRIVLQSQPAPTHKGPPYGTDLASCPAWPYTISLRVGCNSGKLRST